MAVYSETQRQLFHLAIYGFIPQSLCYINMCIITSSGLFNNFWGEKMMEDAVLLSFLFTFHMFHSPGGNYTEEL